MKTVVFEINKNWDLEVFPEFIVDGEAFYEYVVKAHFTDLEDSVGDINKVRNYISNYYKKNLDSIKASLKNAKTKWARIEQDFNVKVTQLFDGFKFKTEEIFCFVGINPASPRFLKEKSFVFFFKGDPYHIIPHELMHFYFFEYTQIKHKKSFSKFSTDNGSYHQLSEIFNNIILDEEFEKLLGGKHEKPYDENKPFQNDFKQLYLEVNKDIDNFILKGIEMLDANKPN